MGATLSIDELSQIIKPILDRYHAEGAALFGSYARGQATPDSDVDLIVYGGDSFEKTDVFAIAEDLFQASGKRVDVYEESEIDEQSDLHREILRDRLVIA